MKINSITKTTANQLIEDVSGLLEKQIGAPTGLNVKISRGSFDPEMGTIRFSVVLEVKTEDGVPATFLRSCVKHGLAASDFRREFVSRGETFAIVGIEPRRRKYPISAERTSDGARFKFGVPARGFNWTMSDEGTQQTV